MPLRRLHARAADLLPLASVALTACAVHQPRPTHDLFGYRGPTIVAHRGYSSVAPENTRAAFAAATEAGFGFELDVGFCADRTLCVLHDDTLDRTTDRTGFLDGITGAEARATDAGSWFDPAFSDETIPTLSEVLTTHAGRHLIDVEIKSPRDGAAYDAAELGTAVAQAIVDAGATEQVFVTSFNPFVLEAVRQAGPAIARGQLFGTFEGTDLSWLEKTALKNLWLNRRALPDILAAEHVLLTEAYVRRMKRRGYRIAAWTVNDPQRIRELASYGVDILITDVPEEAAAALSSLHVGADPR